MVEQLGKLFYGPKLVGYPNFINLRRNLVGLTEPRLLIDFARKCQNHFGEKFPQLVSREFALRFRP
jgi:hypothetical protein